ncbi:MAG: DUF5103 domain-containing protein [Marinilabiliales bacterium]|nr:DUF5103 domain-containing protein [Marinilabiliales bacterium]
MSGPSNTCREYYHVYLIPSADREFRQYFLDDDLNGQYWIAMEESKEPATDADYVYVYFTLPVQREAQGARYMSPRHSTAGATGLTTR